MFFLSSWRRGDGAAQQTVTTSTVLLVDDLLPAELLDDDVIALFMYLSVAGVSSLFFSN